MDWHRNRPVTRRVLSKSGLRANSIEIRHILRQSAMSKLRLFQPGELSKGKIWVPLDDRLRSPSALGLRLKKEKTLRRRRLRCSGT